jgi:hypothetical protein
MANSPQPLLIRQSDVPDVYGLDARPLKRMVEDGRLSHVHPSGPSGSCYLIRAGLDALIAQTTTPAKKPKKGKRRKR